MSTSLAHYRDRASTHEEWLPEVPSHWDLVEGKRLFANRRTASRADDTQLAASQQYGVVPQEMMMRLNDAKVMLALSGTGTFRHVERGDFVISLRSFEGGVEYSDYTGCVSPAYTVLAAQREIAHGYYRHLLKCGPFVAALQATTDSLRDGKAISYGQFGGIRLPFPPLPEQIQIARFLDYETAKIDRLIEKQQQLIALLKEKRQAVISHAVTKGLNPDAPMKDSGVEWLGKVPAHWGVRRLKHISPRIGVGLVINPSTYTTEEGVYFIFGGDVKEHQFDLSCARRMRTADSERLRASRLCAGDLVSVRVGDPGVTAVVPLELEGANCASVVIIRRGEFNSDWLCSAMNSWIGRGQVGLVAYGAAQKQFNVSDAVEFAFPVPPIGEQAAIAGFISRHLEAFERLTTGVETSLALLQERRTALISAAVTGKIDVRGWKPPEGAEAGEAVA